MAFTVSDFGDLVRLLDEHPQWRLELRDRLVKDDMDPLRELVRDLGKSHRRSEGRFEQLEEIIRDLAEAQRRTEQRVNELAEAQNRTEQRLERLEETVDRLVRTVEKSTERFDRVWDKVSQHDGTFLEIHYRWHAPAYFGQWLRRVKTVEVDDLWEQLEGTLGRESAHDAMRIDLVLRGRLYDLPERPEAYLVVEISSVIDDDDVGRALRRAELFRRAGYPAIPVAAGRDIIPNALALAHSRGVAVLQDGKELYWNEALALWPIAGT